MEGQLIQKLVGNYIAFDGVGGCGKSTAARRVAAAIRDAGFPVGEVREPGGTVVSERIRDLLLMKNCDAPMAPETELLLFMAARSQLARERVKSLKEAGHTVIADRCVASSFGYQCGALGVHGSHAFDAYTIAVPHAWRPDLILILDVTAEEACRRRQLTQRDDRYSYEVDLMNKVRQGYTSFASSFPNVVVVDAQPAPDQVMLNVWAALRHWANSQLI